MELIAADNQFENSDCIVTCIVPLHRLKLAIFANCPAYKNDIYYRNKIILASETLGTNNLNLKWICFYLSNFLLLELLDNKQINGVTRLFLKNFEKVKSQQQKVIINSVPCDPNGTANNTIMDIDLRDNDESVKRSDSIGIDVNNIISQAIVENVQCKPWIMFGDCTFLTEYIGTLPEAKHNKNENVPF